MPIPLLGSRSQVAIKAEAVSGEAEILADADVILTTERPTWEPQVEVTERNAQTRSLDTRGAVIGARGAKIAFKQYIRGTESTPSDPGNLPDFTLPFRAAGVVASVVGATTEYAINSDAVQADPGAYFTVGTFIDGKLYQIHGAVCDLTLQFVLGKPILAEYSFLGVYDAPADVPLLNPTYSTVVEPPFLGATLTVLGFSAAKLKTMTIKLGNVHSLRPDPNDLAAAGYFTAQITSRKITGTIDPEETFVADKDFFAEWIAGATGTIDTGVFPNNGLPFNQFRMVVNNAQYKGVKLGDRAGIITAPIDFECRALTDPGDDSILFVQQ